MQDTLDPNDFVNPDDVFEDDYDPEKITLASFAIIPGDGVNHASLVWYDRGINFLGGDTNAKWGISLYYGYRYNGQDLPLHEPSAPRHVLEKLAGTTDLAGYDWSGADWAYFE